MRRTEDIVALDGFLNEEVAILDTSAMHYRDSRGRNLVSVLRRYSAIKFVPEMMVIKGISFLERLISVVQVKSVYFPNGVGQELNGFLDRFDRIMKKMKQNKRSEPVEVSNKRDSLFEFRRYFEDLITLVNVRNIRLKFNREQRDNYDAVFNCLKLLSFTTQDAWTDGEIVAAAAVEAYSNGKVSVVSNDSDIPWLFDNVFCEQSNKLPIEIQSRSISLYGVKERKFGLVTRYP